MRPLLTAILLLFCATFVQAGELTTTTILIPTLYNGGGVFGSTWWSNVVLTNQAAVPFASPGVTFAVLCPIPEGCFSSQVPAGQFGAIATPRPANGLLLYASSEFASKLAFQGRFGQGVPGVTNGTEMPIVRDEDFFTAPIHLPFVALHPSQVPIRSTLRIYGIDALPDTNVRVEVRAWSSPTGEALASKVVRLEVPPSPAGVSRPIYPAFSQISLQSEFPFEQLLGSYFAITVVPLPLPNDAVPRIWAFISTTDNNTQETSIQQPQ
jgi:hypothetical protein